MKSSEKRNFRVKYAKDDQTEGYFHIAAESAFDAKVDFLMQTRHPRESILSIEMQDGREWVRCLHSNERRKSCGHEQDRMCGCIADMSTANQLIFIAGNIRDVQWELDYATLAEPEEMRLCIVGICGKCGDRLCYGIFLGGEATGDKLIESIYTYLALFHKLDGLQIDAGRFEDKFLRLFHEQDRPDVEKWLKERGRG